MPVAFIFFTVAILPALLVAYFIFKKLNQNGNRYALLISIFSFFVTGAAIAFGGFFAILYFGSFTR